MAKWKSSFRLTNPKKKRRVNVDKEVIGPENVTNMGSGHFTPRRLLVLPIEVRNKIYGYVPDEEDDTKPKKGKKEKYSNELGQYKVIDSCTALSQASRQLFVHVSGSGLLYSANDFYFHTPHHLSTYLNDLNHHHQAFSFRALHLHIQITSSAPNIQQSLTTLSSLSSLRQLHLEFDCRTSVCKIESSRQMRRRIYRVKQDVLTKLGEANWGLLGANLVDFEMKFSVSLKTEKDGRFWTYHDGQDERVEGLKGKIKEVVLRRRRE